MPAMHVAIIASKQGGKTYYSKLLRRSFRDENGKVQKKTLANLSSLSDETIALVRGSLAGKQYVEASDAFEILRSRKHGPVAAIAAAFDRLGMIELIGSEPCRERDLVCAMIAARIIRPHSKLATTRWWKDTTLDEMFGVDDAEVDELYAAMDWLGKRQNRIQGKLARRHFRDGGLVLFDLTSSYFEGTTCPLGRRGHNRDGKKGKLQVNFGLLCDVGGCPVSVSVYAGNIGDPKTLLPEVARLQKRFGLQRVAIVGDRGMIAQTRITDLKKLDGVDWITALKSATIQKLIRTSSLDVAQFDEVNLFEVLHPDYPGERLVACRNPRLAARRAHTRESLLQATEADLAVIRKSVDGGTLRGGAEIGVRVGQAINRFRMKKHMNYEIGDTSFAFSRNAENIAREAALDGIYVIRTSLPEQDMAADDCVRSYKALTRVERAFRSMKTVNLHVRPIYHRIAQRVRTHIFLCTLAYYVEWHIRSLEGPVVLRSGTRGDQPHPRSCRSRRTLTACQTQGRRMARGWLRNPLLPNPDRKPGDHYPKYMQDPARPAGYQSRARNLRYGHNADQIPNKGDGVAGNHSRPKTQAQHGRTQNVGRKSDFRKCAIDCHITAFAQNPVRTSV